MKKETIGQELAEQEEITQEGWRKYFKELAGNKFDINVLFGNYEHKERYLELVEKDNLTGADAYRETLFYILASCDDLYNQAHKLYDFDERRIIIENDADLTSTTSKLVALGFELFTNRNVMEMDTVDIFDYLDSKLFNVAVNALRVRFRKMP